MKPCFMPADMLLPNEKIEMGKWAVIACDQYTSQPEYWERVREIVGSSESALNLVFPEVYLGKEDGRIENICASMKEYLKNGTVTKAVTNGFILVEREVGHGTRTGLIGVIDLEEYDYDPGSKKLIRATEGTVLSRIPPRVRIRENAVLECPHVMLLIDDPERQLIEPLAAEKEVLRKLYDFDLMLGGGNVKGYAIEGERAESLTTLIAQMQAESDNFFLAAGDGNHSLATAKTCWEKIKASLSEEEKAAHPARFSMVEVINLHDDSLNFEPIHRVVEDFDRETILKHFNKYIEDNGLAGREGDEIIFVDNSENKVGFALDGLNGRLPVDVLQRFLDELTKNDPEKLDYIHGEDHVKELVKKKKATGILLKSIDKSSLFPGIAAGGVLPRKTFSIGHADEKRFYVESRTITV
ncbi:MAG: DUF1015 domain-containing protein [Synergistaceae bacterium]